MVTRETSLRRGLEALGARPPPDAVERLLEFLDVLASEALPRGFVGPDEGDRLLQRHVLESAALLRHIGEGADPLIDVGTGAGLPGVVLACLRPGPVTLLEAEARRADFLERAVFRLGLACPVIRGRAEEAGRDPGLREVFGCAVARALAPPPVALELLLPFVRLGGRAVLAVGPSAVEGLQAARLASEALGGGDPETEPLEVPGLDRARWVMIVSKTQRCPQRFPRRTGVPGRRPLGG